MNDRDLANLIRDHRARLTLIGQGYVGLPLAVEFARAGFPVTGLDTDPERVAALNLGRSHSDGITPKAVEVTDGDLASSNCVLILTDHPAFDYRRIVERASLIVDTRNATWAIPAPAGRVIAL